MADVAESMLRTVGTNPHGRALMAAASLTPASIRARMRLIPPSVAPALARMPRLRAVDAHLDGLDGSQGEGVTKARACRRGPPNADAR